MEMYTSNCEFEYPHQIKVVKLRYIPIQDASSPVNFILDVGCLNCEKSVDEKTYVQPIMI